MGFKLKVEENRGKSTVLLSVLILILGTVCATFSQTGIIFVPVLTAFLAFLFVLEKGQRRIMSFVLPILIIAIDLVFNDIYSFNCAISVLLGLIVYLSFTKPTFSKGEYAIIATALMALFITFMFFLSAFYELKSWDFNMALEYYEKIFAELRSTYIDKMLEYAGSFKEQINTEVLTPELIGATFDMYLNMIISVITVSAFFFVGVGYKIFSFIAVRYAKNTECVRKWRFSTPSMFAYFYIILYAVNIFSGGGTDIASISIFNLTNIFMFIYAYIGFVFAISILERRMNKLASVIVAVFAVLLLYSFAFSILSMLGVFVVISSDRANMSEGSDSNSID